MYKMTDFLTMSLSSIPSFTLIILFTLSNDYVKIVVIFNILVKFVHSIFDFLKHQLDLEKFRL
jgi:hypothetical protein